MRVLNFGKGKHQKILTKMTLNLNSILKKLLILVLMVAQEFHSLEQQKKLLEKY